MAFKASKKRERREPEKVGLGSPITPSYALSLWYRKELNAVIAEMVNDYQFNIDQAFVHPEVRKYFAMDSAASFLTGLLNRLKKKWANQFNRVAADLSKRFVERIDEQATIATFSSLKVAGMEAPKAKYTEAVKNTIQGFEEWNKTLITNVGAQVHEKVFNAVMLSLTSADPEEQGMPGIQKALREVGIKEKRRVKFIAQDQVSKIYGALADQRMEDNGVEEFDWIHSGAGKHPRQCHAHMNGMRFKINDPRLWEIGGELGLTKRDLGPPGWAIGCRCKRRPVI
ncbi:minor capsid protein [Pantoea phage Kyle]|uniref:Minor capsid protein n=1 Tax=Pantoea phage Kyle TaxID=2589665 RepID=A0A514A8S8_9CAUD|nr:head morphogenesis [Pantoea phage Kyle]QDH49681.1 minor capsid protein [Pantoea phage Kyle]